MFSVTLIIAQKFELERTLKLRSFSPLQMKTLGLRRLFPVLYSLLVYPKGDKGVINYRVPALSLEIIAEVSCCQEAFPSPVTKMSGELSLIIIHSSLFINHYSLIINQHSKYQK